MEGSGLPLKAPEPSGGKPFEPPLGFRLAQTSYRRPKAAPTDDLPLPGAERQRTAGADGEAHGHRGAHASDHGGWLGGWAAGRLGGWIGGRVGGREGAGWEFICCEGACLKESRHEVVATRADWTFGFGPTKRGFLRARRSF